jgi:ParB family chromosome partitioning protein
MSTRIAIAKIKVGERYRVDLGDIAGLAASIVEIGLLNPITIKEDGTLLAGQRRLEAFKLLGRTKIPVRIWDGLDA